MKQLRIGLLMISLIFVLIKPAYTQLTYNLYFGDTHGHTLLSDGGCQTSNIDEYYSFAKDILRLDFAMMSDHARGLTSDEWQVVRQKAESFNQPGIFTTFIGFEWTSVIYGHKNVYFPGEDVPVMPWSSMNPDYDTPDELWDAAQEYRAFTVAHHPLTNIPSSTNWSFRDDALQPIVEIYSKWGNSEYDGAEPEVPYPAISGDHSVQEALALGHKLGIWASTDSHSGWAGFLSPREFGGPGCDNLLPHRGGWAAVWAENNTRKALWDAFLNRRVYATTGERISLLFIMDGHFMGSTYTTCASPNIHIEVTGTLPLQRVEIIRNNNLIYTYTASEELSVTLDYTDSGLDLGDYYYYVRVVQDNKNPNRDDQPERAWSSPIWVTISLSMCGDGYCKGSPEEDCFTCPEDCISRPVPSCGNGTCNTAEDCYSCPEDCPGKTTGKLEDRFCCGEDDNCYKDTPGLCGEDCGTTVVELEYCCGDGLCEVDETSNNCETDCINLCGNNNCEIGEDCTICSEDCPGDNLGRPQDRYCCGNGICEDVERDNANCPIDCTL